MRGTIRWFYLIVVLALGLPLTGMAQNQTVCLGGSATFYAGDYRGYQWYHYAPNVGLVELTGETGASLNLTNVQAEDAGGYYCEVRYRCGFSGSCYDLRYIGSLTISQTINITGQPDDQETVCQGGSYSTSVTSPGASTYQWHKDAPNTNNPVTGQDGATLSLSNLQPSQSGSYYCYVTGPCGSAWSNAVVLAVNPSTTASTPTLGSNPLCQGTTTSVSASFGGGATDGSFSDGDVGGTFSVAKNGTLITGTYTPPASYTGLVTITFTTNDPDGPCPAATSTATVTVNPAATASAITAGASSICKNGTTTFKASWGGAATYGGFTDGGIGGTFTYVSLVGTEITYAYTPPLNFTGDITMYFVTTDPPGVCSYATTTTTLTVNPPPTVGITGLASSYCQNASAFALTGNPTGGTFKVDGTPATHFNPAALSVGNHSVEYTYTDGNGCTSSTSQSVEIINPVFTSGATVSGPACAGQTLTLSFGVSCTGSATFTAQLSDKEGSFAAPTATWPVVPGANVLTLPTHLPTGEGYRLRVLQSVPALISEQSASFKITALMVALYPATPGKLCQGDALPVTFGTLGNCPYPAGNVFTAQLSNATGSFANPRVLGTASPGTTTFPASALAGLPLGTGYRVRIVSSNPAQTSQPSLPFRLEGPSLAVTPGVAGAPLCRGSAVTVSFSLPTGSCPFPDGNAFTAQLSNATGGFGSPVSLGPVQPGASNSLTIPANTPAGTGYRIRLVSSNPALTSQNSSPFRVNACASRMSAEEAVLTVAPNPATGREIRLRVAGLNSPCFTLFAPSGGTLLLRTDLGNQPGEFVLRPERLLPTGVYILEATEGTTRLTQKVLVVE